MTNRRPRQVAAGTVWLAWVFAPAEAAARLVFSGPGAEAQARAAGEGRFLAVACSVLFLLLFCLACFGDRRRRIPRALLAAGALPLLVVAAWLLPMLL